MSARKRKIPAPKKGPAKSLIECKSGPWKGEYLALSSDSGEATGWLTIGAETGRYSKGAWEPAAIEVAYVEPMRRAA